MLHTRISEQLADDIRRFAEDLRVPASNLVRNVLEEVFAIVDDVSDDVGDLFDEVVREAEGVRERVREQAASQGRQRSRSRGARRHRRRGRDPVDDETVEAELRHDEARERASSRGGDAPHDAEPAGTGTTASSDRNEAEAKPRAAELFPEILGWQPLVLNRDFECGRCARALAAGESAFLGIGEGGLTQTALCGRCAGHR